ncbi:MarR family winged helix-turn-helix transcriptional regulator [Flavisphingomonas formosensis]|uniref:MarR family winged helix-turn-helix transcriptional regulator n=1 Tax=Flavisphingomonas formosensis TaxID=861534 RepID=UPI0012FB89CE|nr:MarR family transcriptional regulator [Sphingomonas formosensis]
MACKVFAGRDLTLAQWIALKEIDRGEFTTNSQIACMLGHSSGATTRMIDQLESRGLLTRIRLPGDRRVVTLAVTDEGRQAVLDMVPGMTVLWQEVLQDLTDAESDTLLTLLGRVVDRLERTVSEDR